MRRHVFEDLYHRFHSCLCARDLLVRVVRDMKVEEMGEKEV